MTASIESLMERYVAGDDRSMREIYRRTSPSLRRQIRSRIRNPEDVEDILQMTFLKAHKARDNFKSGLAVTSWYSMIARNVTFDHLRRLYRERDVMRDTFGGDTDVLIDSMQAPWPDVETSALEQERQIDLVGRVRSAVERLPDVQRDVVRMNKFEGRTMAEISEMLGVREGTLRVRAHRGYKALVRDLGACGS